MGSCRPEQPLRVGAHGDALCRSELPRVRENGVVGHPFFEMSEGRTLFRWSFWPPLRPLSFGMAVTSMPAQIACGRFTSPRCCLDLDDKRSLLPHALGDLGEVRILSEPPLPHTLERLSNKPRRQRPSAPPARAFAPLSRFADGHTAGVRAKYFQPDPTSKKRGGIGAALSVSKADGLD